MDYTLKHHKDTSKYHKRYVLHVILLQHAVQVPVI